MTNADESSLPETGQPGDATDVVVLLTATVDPSGVAFMAVEDRNVRLAEYLDAVRQWVQEECIDGMVFCENSGADIGLVREELARAPFPVEVLQFSGQDFDRSLGKGFGEMSTIRYALEHSSLASRARWVVKANGRYALGNAARLIGEIRRLAETRVSADLRRMLTFADSRVFAFSPGFFVERMVPLHPIVNDAKGIWFEHVLARAIHAEMAVGGSWVPLPVDPLIKGRGGTSGRVYPTGIHRVIVRAVRRRAMRWLMGR